MEAMSIAVVRRLDAWAIHELAVKVHVLDAELQQLAQRLPGRSPSRRHRLKKEPASSMHEEPSFFGLIGGDAEFRLMSSGKQTITRPQQLPLTENGNPHQKS
jgi:hypothetical protein